MGLEPRPNPWQKIMLCSRNGGTSFIPSVLCCAQVLHPGRAHGVVSRAAAAVRAGTHPLHARPLEGPRQQGRDQGRGGTAVPVQSGALNGRGGGGGEVCHKQNCVVLKMAHVFSLFSAHD